MSFLAALLLAAPASPAVAAPYPSVAVLNAFREGCGDVRDLSQVEAKLKTQGWAPMVPAKGSPLEALIAFGKDAGKKMLDAESGTMTEPVILARTVMGEDLSIVLSGVSMAGREVSGCRLYDVGETRRITIAEAENWLRRKASGTRDQKDLTAANWSPGLSETQDSFTLYFIPTDSPLIELLKVSGVALKADFVKSTN